MNLVMLGAPGSGKGTQAAVLSERHKLRHVSSGDLLRAAVARQDEFGKEIEGMISSGKLVPDGKVLRLVKDAILDNEGDKWTGWILDGYPRTAGQAEALEGVLGGVSQAIDAVVFLDVNADEVVSRLSSRRTCGSCKAVYNLANKPPKQDGKCDNCDGELVQRSDDKPETIRERLSVYNDATLPVLGFYDSRRKVHRVDGSRSIDEIKNELAGLVG